MKAPRSGAATISPNGVRRFRLGMDSSPVTADTSGASGRQRGPASTVKRAASTGRGFPQMARRQTIVEQTASKAGNGNGESRPVPATGGRGREPASPGRRRTWSRHFLKGIRTGGSTSDHLAAAYAQHRRIHPKVLRKLVEAAGASGSDPVLEIGCGSGNYIAAVQSATGCRCFGVDPSARMLDAAQGQETRR